MRSRLPTIILLLVAVSAPQATAQDDGATEIPSPAELLQKFADDWDESQWRQKFRGNAGYMRASDDRGWQHRMIALQQLVSHGQEAVPTLRKALTSGSVPERILASQSLGFLAPYVPPKPLLDAARSDSDAAVRLYAVDSLAMTGRDERDVDWNALLRAETNRDVRKHIEYARDRAGKRIDPQVVRQLIEWNSELINSARMGQAAPDFELQAATGETVKLRDYRGSKAVVLVFIYGDT